MEAFGLAGSVIHLVGLCRGITDAVQYLHARIDSEHGDYRRSLRELQEAIDHTRTQVSKANDIISAGLEENYNLATKQAVKDIGSAMQSIDGVWYDTGKIPSRAATWGTRRRRPSHTTIERWPKVTRLSPHTAIPVDDLNFIEDVSGRISEIAPDPQFYDFGNSSRSIFDEAEAIKSGGTSQVFRVRIHLGHIDDGGERKKEVAFAVKKINGTFQDYARERDAYQRLSLAQNPHPHIFPLLATYRMEGKYHFVFPFANCDLAMYLRHQPRPSNAKRSLEWFGGQMRGLADALTTVHGRYRDSQQAQRGIYGVHGDIKPENILCFGSDDRWTAFALTDFGSSYFCTAEEKDIPKGLKHTPVYRAPEVDTTGGITQAYDIWSLGCVYAEAITWFLEGKAGMAKLIEARLDEEDNSPNRDAFFRLKYNKRGGLTAKLKPEVQRVSHPCLYLYLRINSNLYECIASYFPSWELSVNPLHR
jgi:hypothetical protein